MIIAVTDATCAVAKRKPEKNSGLHGIRTLDLCDTGAALLPIQPKKKKANWEQVVELVRYKPRNDDDESYEYMKITYVNCRMKN